MIAIAAPSAAPEATPSRNGPASGLRNTPWYEAPDSASAAPTAPAAITLGSRMSSTIVSCVAGTATSTLTIGRRSSRMRSTVAGGMSAAPCVSATSATTTSSAAAASAGPGARGTTRGSHAARAAGGAATASPTRAPRDSRATETPLRCEGQGGSDASSAGGPSAACRRLSSQVRDSAQAGVLACPGAGSCRAARLTVAGQRRTYTGFPSCCASVTVARRLVRGHARRPTAAAPPPSASASR